MKIALNGQNILISNPAGPERFTLNLYKYLSKYDRNNQYTVFLNDKPTDQLKSELFTGNPNFTFTVIEQKPLWTQWHLALNIIFGKYDIFFSPRHTFPVIAKPFTKIIVMFHGLEYKTNQEFSGGSLIGYWHPFTMRIVATLADKIITPSLSTKQALIDEHWFSDADKIKVIHEGVDENFHSRDIQQIAPTLNKFELESKKYLLFISTIQPRKNLPRLVEAFAKSQNTGDCKLVIVGKLGWTYTKSLNAPKDFGVENKVKFLQWIDQPDLYDLISSALGYVNFSLDEGFGLTILEAMASEIPVAASDIPAHHEIAGDTILYAKADDVNDIRSKLDEILTGNYPAPLIAQAKERTKEFTWQNTAQKFVDQFTSTARH